MGTLIEYEDFVKSHSIIQDNLRLDIIRSQIVNKNTLKETGSMYVYNSYISFGNGIKASTIRALNPGDEGVALVCNPTYYDDSGKSWYTPGVGYSQLSDYGIANFCITNEKIADGAVNTEHISGTIPVSKITGISFQREFGDLGGIWITYDED